MVHMAMYEGLVEGPRANKHEQVLTTGTYQHEITDDVTQTSKQRFTSKAHCTPSPPSPPPDGGTQAWLTSILALFVLFNSWGFIQSFGVFQTYYATTLSATPSTMSWIGSIQVFLVFSLGIFAGRATDAGYFHHVFGFGLLVQLLGVFMLSLTRAYWQILLTQGVCLGVGGGCQFVSTLSVLSTYFDKRRALAMGIAATGTTVGSIVMPVIVQQLLPVIGFAWTVRCLGLMMTVLGLAAAIGLRTRVPPRNSGPLMDWSAFAELPFGLFCVGVFFAFWGAYFPFYYIGLYARDILHTDYRTSISLLLVMNGVGVPGRLLPNIIADRCLGSVNIMALSSFNGAIIVFSWAAVRSEMGLWIFAAFFGFFSAGIQSLFPASLATLTPDPQKRGTRMGIGFAVAGFACLTGTPLGGALVQANDGHYLYVQIWTGLSMLAGTLFLVASKMAVNRITSNENRAEKSGN
ncbi:MFS general substrate transporter [Macroventuria anomochaeta]|uniref:MFS general substrate transporter n=1 Tax=Macroventuria anomochaeta TaxID=301207 RepID=A0ACB6S2Z9_9PLEO|nr:MFS general substrate transporter [Macroventuria anomochaeta]KAF2628030.1 MFS general substrate transporter [Macroventuria anomochaeta]